MEKDECLICKKHYSQSGNCSANKKNCLLFEEEIKGKKIRIEIIVNLNTCHTPASETIEYGSILKCNDKNKEMNYEVIKINKIDIQSLKAYLTVEYYENEMPSFEKKKRFKVLHGSSSE